MSKNEIHWAIFSGSIMLPFSIRTTKKQSIENYTDNQLRTLHRMETCRKVVINEYQKDGK